MSEIKDKALNREGVLIDYLHFNSDELNSWLRDSEVNKPRTKGDKALVDVKYDSSKPFNKIMVEHPVTGEFLEVPIVDEQKDLIGDMTRLQWKMVRKLAREKLEIKKTSQDAAITQAQILKEVFAIKRNIHELLLSKDKLTQQDAKLLGVSAESSSGDELCYPTDVLSLVSANDEEVEWEEYDPY